MFNATTMRKATAYDVINTIVLVYYFEEKNNVVKMNNVQEMFISITHSNKTTIINHLHN